MSEPRPKFSAEVGNTAALQLAEKLARDGLLDPDQIKEAAEDIAEYARPHMDGYEIARQLERYAHWDCDLQIAEVLDEWGHLVNQLVQRAEKAWAERNNVQPPLPSGARVSLRSKETGTITHIYEYGAAKYCVAIDGDPEANSARQSRRIVNFEDVTAI